MTSLTHLTYSARKPRGLGAPVSPAAMTEGIAENDLQVAGTAVTRRIGRVRADCMVWSSGVSGAGWRVERGKNREYVGCRSQ